MSDDMSIEEEWVECPNRWLSRKDAMVVAMAIAKSEPWPHRLSVTVAALMCRVTRLADRRVITLEGHHEDRPISPTALNYLKAQATSATFDAVKAHHEIEEALHRSERHGLSSPVEVMRINLLTTVLGAGYVAEENWHRGLRAAERYQARIDLATRQRKALGGD